MRNYFAKKLKKELNKGKPIVHNTLRRIEFSVDNVYYTYEYKTTSNSGFFYIHKGDKLIYGPYPDQCTEEGVKIYSLLCESKIL